MSVERIDESDSALSGLLERAGREPIILETRSRGEFAVLRLDDDVLDLLLERSPRLIAECQALRERVKRGDYLTHEQVLAELGLDAPTGPEL